MNIPSVNELQNIVIINKVTALKLAVNTNSTEQAPAPPEGAKQIYHCPLRGCGGLDVVNIITTKK
jgi:hypothetical protein